MGQLLLFIPNWISVLLSNSQVCTQTFLHPKATLIVFARDTSRTNSRRMEPAEVAEARELEQEQVDPEEEGDEDEVSPDI